MKIKSITLTCLLSASVANAASVALVNPDFENIDQADGAVEGTLAVAGWTKAGTTGDSGVYNADTTYYTDADITDPPNTGVIGTMAGDSTAFIFKSDGGSLTQTTGEEVKEGTVYNLIVAVGHRDTAAYTTATDAVTYGGYNIQLLDDDSVLASAFSNDVVATGSFGDVTFKYTGQAGDTGNLRIRLASNINDGTRYIDFDNVRLDAEPVPEPSSTALLGLGGLALILRRKK